jgi:putative GTP pyrophosphokinase
MKVPNRQKLEDEYRHLRPVFESILQLIEGRFHDWFKKEDLHFGIKFRVKNFKSFFEKYVKKFRHNNHVQVTDISDILGFRIICPFLEDIKKAETLVRQNFKILEEEHKLVSQNFREFGYESLHFVVQIPDDIRRVSPLETTPNLEIQIRTILQDAWAEVEHELIYKSRFAPYDEPLKRKLAALNANLTLSDIIFQEIRDYQRQLTHQLNLRRITFLKHMNEQEVVEEGSSPSINAHEDNLSSEFNSIDQLLLDALSFHNKGAYKKAINFYSAILRRPTTGYVRSLVLVHRGMAYFAEKLYENALDDFNQSIVEDAQNPKAYYYRGLVMDYLNNPHHALEDYNKSLELVPLQYEVLLARAKVHKRLHNIEEALRDCRAVLNLHPEIKEAQQLAEELHGESSKEFLIAKADK